jgi:hypothetical protein
VIESTSKLAINAQKLVINGTAFDPAAAGNGVDFNLGAVGTVTAATTTQLTVTLSTQPNATGPLTAVVTAFGNSSGAAVQVATVVDAPAVSASSAQMARTAPSLAITGSGFDPAAAGNGVDFNLGAVGVVIAATTTQLTVTLSAQPNATGPLTAVVNSFGGSSGAAVQVATVLDAPNVTASSALLARTAPTIVIKGTFFDPTPAGNGVDFNLGAVGVVTAATATQLTVTLSAQPTSNGPLTAVVTAFGGSSGAAVQVGTVVDPPIVAAGDTLSCARTLRGDVRCWGASEDNQSDVPPDLGAVESLSVGYHHACARTADAGYVRCWGSNSAGQSSPPADLGPVTTVSAGGLHSCAIPAAPPLGQNCLRQLVCWGDNTHRQSDACRWSGVTGYRFKDVAAGPQDSCAATSSDEPEKVALFCWGDQTYGQGGVPPEIPLAAGAVESMGLGLFHTAVSLIDGRVIVWGLVEKNQLAPPLWLGPVTRIVSGAYFLCAQRMADGFLRCWGSNLRGQLNVPADLGPVVSFSAGTYHVCATTLYGAIRCVFVCFLRCCQPLFMCSLPVFCSP